VQAGGQYPGVKSPKQWLENVCSSCLSRSYCPDGSLTGWKDPTCPNSGRWEMPLLESSKEKAMIDCG